MHPKYRRFVILASIAILTITVLAVFLVPTALASHIFPDVPDSHWAHDYISWLFNNGITSGFPDGTYRPDNNVTRAEMAVFLQQVAGAGTAGPVTDADMLDGVDSSAFLQQGDRFTTAWVVVDSDADIRRQSGGFIVIKGVVGVYNVDHPNIDESAVGFAVSSYNRPGVGTTPAVVTLFANNAAGFNVRTYDTSGTAIDHDFSLVIPFVIDDGSSVAASSVSEGEDSFVADNE